MPASGRVKTKTLQPPSPAGNEQSSHHHIQRVDNDETSTYCWKVHIRRRGKKIYKYFTDAVYGSKRKALEAAIVYRDALMKTNSDAEYAMWKRNLVLPRNTSGIVGVARYIRRDKLSSGVTENPVWEAFWHDADGKRHLRRFSVHKYGDAWAKYLACQARLEAMEEVRQELIRRGQLYCGV